MDQATQRNAAAAEELSSTAEEMTSQAQALQALMAFFKLADATPAEPEAPAARRAAFAARVQNRLSPADAGCRGRRLPALLRATMPQLAVTNLKGL